MKFEQINETEINLNALSFDFCDDEFISQYYKNKLEEITDKNEWINNHSESLKKEADRIKKAVEMGIIPNTKAETIWQYNIDKKKNAAEKVIILKNKIAKNKEKIITDVSKELKKYLPNWKADEANIIFTINEKADFCINNNIITIDLDRLLSEDDAIHEITKGLTHELFHFWMGENNEWIDYKIDDYSDELIKYRILFKTIDEGLAVLIGEQSLRQHHEEQGTDYEKFKEKSFLNFHTFQKENERNELLKCSEKFKNMGEFYIVGYKIVKTVLNKIGLDEFKKLIIATKEGNPQAFINKYEEIIEIKE